MFQSARLKLTVWYVLIIAIVSILFSTAFYTSVNREISRLEYVEFVRDLQRKSLQLPLPPESLDTEGLRFRLVTTLGVIDLTIIVFASLAGYFLAGRTLKPISDMVDDQNRFIADASHELRTPLTSLKSEIEVSLRDRQFNLPEAKKLLVSNLEEVNKLQNLSDNLIKLTQYRKVNENILFKKESLDLIIKDSIKRVYGVAKGRNIKIINKVKDVKVEIERNTITELFVILLDNAIKYSSKNKEVIVESSRTDGRVSIKLTDNGIGINKSDLPHLFERFYRGDKSRSKSTVNGYGLGLSIAKEIIDKHGGTIEVESHAGVGSTFTVKIPLKHSLRLI